MAARLQKRHDEETRKRIQASQLVNRLHNIAMGKVEADATQVRAAQALLNKVLPDLKAVEIGGGGEDGEIVVRWKS
jgi:hypothetical protein